jgi:hypothetical protein
MRNNGLLVRVAASLDGISWNAVFHVNGIGILFAVLYISVSRQMAA